MDDTEYWEQGTKNLDRMVADLDAWVGIFSEPRRTQVRRLLDGPVGEAFVTAPASTKRGFHYAFPGGLLMHSLNVVHSALKVSEALAPSRWSNEMIVFCALFHDLGKAGDGVDPYYVVSKELWRSERGYNYELNSRPGYHFMPSSELGVFVLQQNGVQMTREEYLAIRLNDGAAAEGNEPYSFRTPDLALIIHWADHWSSVCEKAVER